MSRSHIKRLVMPRSWPLTRKTNIWVQKPNPGGHNTEMCMPLGIVLRDVLSIAHNMREAKRILHSRNVSVDGRVETDRSRGVGLMDVLTIGEDNYRCVLDTNGKLRYRPISKKAAGSKICRVTGKTTIKGGKTQIHLHDGRNIAVDDPPKYKSGDSLVISLPDQAISSHIAMKKGALAYLTGGNHIGETAVIQSQEVKRSSKPNETSFEEFGTITDYVFIISKTTDLPLEGDS
ncbi:MAG: 30S ribosomal protein S4e [Candidatus Thalassarchaeaceae archaeon]|jgi:small subunit ribosomal protein S4e|nr:30S ribosomal protein S4e [Candidatus Thalassarchaeaceae archaeon]MDP6703017.1 30S ribosomal protein S4e [Candidatus Thalassarchaeaceae archaeon]MDP7004149.1 30S ribosomal protein S4e [Candidatus Thalassarchaeaceae archaeon]